jgi:hypothetical protein
LPLAPAWATVVVVVALPTLATPLVGEPPQAARRRASPPAARPARTVLVEPARVTVPIVDRLP